MKLEEKFNNYYKELEEAMSAEDKKKRFCDWHGFDYNGEGYAIIGETYSIKDSIKKLGGVWNKELRRWVCPKDISKEINRPVHKVTADDFYYKGADGVWDYRYIKEDNVDAVQLTFAAEDKQWQASNKKDEPNSNSDYISQEGDRISVNLKSVEFKGFTSGGYFIYDMEDSNGNKLVWYSSNDFRSSLETIKSVTGTIIRNQEYKGTKYTQLTRCHFSSQQVKPFISSRPESSRSNSLKKLGIKVAGDSAEFPDNYFEDLNS